MPRLPITKKIVDAATPRTDKSNTDLYLWDAGKGSVMGFGLKVTPAGGKYFVLQYRLRGSRSDKRYKIGRYGDWTPDQAREQARELRRLVDAGIDPFERDKAAARQREIEKLDAVDKALAAVADRWLEAYAVKQGKDRSPSSMSMARLVVAKLKDAFPGQQIDKITRKDLMAAMDKIPAKRIATRRNFFAYSRILWKWAEERDLVSDNPFERMQAPAAPISRDRTLNDEELAVFLRASRKLSYPFGPIFRLLAITGQRRAEVSGMRWEELDKKSATWRIPGTRTKNGKAHLVALSPMAIAELDAIAPKETWPTKSLVFTTTGKTAASGLSRAKRRLDAEMTALAKEQGGKRIAAWRPHDLRRSLATGFQRLGIRWEVTEAVLNHLSGSRAGVAGIYQKHDWQAESREALGAWSEHLSGLLRPTVAREPSTQAS
jgi:integrase